MTKRNSLILLLLLGAGLLYLGNPAPEPPDAGRPIAVSSHAESEKTPPHEGTAQLTVSHILQEKIDYVPARAAFLETIVLQGSPGDKKAAIRELKRLGTLEAVQTLSFAVGDEDDRIRTAALEALAAIGSDEALAAIAGAARSDSPADRALAAEALARSGGHSSADYLELALHDDDPRVRAAAIEALGDIGDSRSVTIISQALRDRDPAVRQRAVEVLDRLDDEALFHTLYPRQ